ncbi:MAG: nitrate reductase cytochrome c-type subunit, partial [Planctomycetaceae bacterium]|nr:nitrate reductase cytochrome c-type subunit [Planctomycetaceae bacterium]
RCDGQHQQGTGLQEVRHQGGESVMPFRPLLSGWAPTLSISLILLAVLVFLPGCGRQKPESIPTTPRTTAQRAVRRAYDGAPPVIPHKPMNADCVTCHTETGQQVPERGFAAANPHVHSSQAGALSNCRQCHLFQNSARVFVENSFVGIPQSFTPGNRAYPGAPPMVPHRKLMRENCLACHSGPSARPEIRCSHTTRTNCVQCHLFQTTDDRSFVVREPE